MISDKLKRLAVGHHKNRDLAPTLPGASELDLRLRREQTRGGLSWEREGGRGTVGMTVVIFLTSYSSVQGARHVCLIIQHMQICSVVLSPAREGPLVSMRHDGILEKHMSS